jgi:hypothetical protein
MPAQVTYVAIRCPAHLAPPVAPTYGYHYI